MRRTEREVKDVAFMHQVLQDAAEIYVAMNAEGAPYLLPFNFVFLDGCIYIHCAREGRKMDLLRADARVAFATAVDIQVEKTTTRYRSVAGTGTVELVEDDALKNKVLMALAQRFNAPCKFPVSPAKFSATQIVCIHVATLTGKYSHPAEGVRPVPHYTE